MPPGNPNEYVFLGLFRKIPYQSGVTRTDQIVLSSYFDLDPFFNQPGGDKWELYHDIDSNGRPILLISYKQAWAFLDYVHHETGIKLPRTLEGPYRYKRTVKEPVKIGTVDHRAHWEKLKEQWGLVSGGAADKEARKRQQAARQAQSRKENRIQLEKARMLLGMGKEGEKGQGLVAGEIGEDGSVKISAAATTTLKKQKPSPNKDKPEDIPYFVCVDCESYERNHSAITEIGIATLDMGVLPSPSITGISHTYETILPLINYKHIRIFENRRLRNGRFVADAADLFRFGTTEINKLAELPKILGEAFTPPPLSDEPVLESNTERRKRRRVVAFVGHDAHTDLNYLSDCKFDAKGFVKDLLERLDAEETIAEADEMGISLAQAAEAASWKQRHMEIFDTAIMYKVMTEDSQTTGLGKMAKELGLNPIHLHNAGNDAAYTLRGFVKMCEMEEEKGIVEENKGGIPPSQVQAQAGAA